MNANACSSCYTSPCAHVQTKLFRVHLRNRFQPVSDASLYFMTIEVAGVQIECSPKRQLAYDELDLRRCVAEKKNMSGQGRAQEGKEKDDVRVEPEEADFKNECTGGPGFQASAGILFKP